MSNLKADIYKLIDTYKSSFEKNKYNGGTVKNYKIRIDLLIDKYCNKKLCNCSVKDKREIQVQVAINVT